MKNYTLDNFILTIKKYIFLIHENTLIYKI